MTADFNIAEPIARAITQLLEPHAEVVIHDIDKDKIRSIHNNFSKRQPGDQSLLSANDLPNDATVIGPYNKANWDGRLLKSISSVIKDNWGNPRLLLCINLDVSHLEKAQTLISHFLQPPSKPGSTTPLFQDDWREKINHYVQQYLQKHQLTVDRLNWRQKRQLVQHLHESGAFNGRNAANYIAHILHVSRATVYNYLK